MEAGSRIHLGSLSALRRDIRMVHTARPSRPMFPSVRGELARTDSGAAVIETTPNPDGSFEFPKVPPGTYMTRIIGNANVSPVGPSQRIYVGEDDVSGFQIPLSIRTTVTGRITVV